MNEIRNINTLSADIYEDFQRLVCISISLDKHVSPDYREGFQDGVRALQSRFLKAMDNNELVYQRKSK